MDDYDDILLRYSKQLNDLIDGHQLETNALLETNRQLQDAVCRYRNAIKQKDEQLKQKDTYIAQLEQRIEDLEKTTISIGTLAMGDHVENKIMQQPQKEFAS